jgi:mannose-6-phosphate isomerase
LVSCRYFTTNLIEAGSGETIRFSDSNDSFSIYICLEGKAHLTDTGGGATEIRQGETVLFPAENPAKEMRFEETGKILKTFM